MCECGAGLPGVVSQDMLSERLVTAEAAVRGRTMRVLELEGKVDELTRQLSDARKAGATKDVECERLVARHEAAAAEAEELAEQLSLKQNEVGRLEEALSSGPATLGAVAARAEGTASDAGDGCECSAGWV